MKVNIEKFIEDFQLRSFGAKGWKNSRFLDCPFCGKDYTKFGILLLDSGSGVYKCFRCDSKGSIFSLLKKINRTDLITNNRDNYSYKDKLDSFLKIIERESIDLNLEEVSPPLGFKRIYEHSYLRERGWSDNDFLKLEVGISNFSRYKNRIIFLIKENGKLVSFISRSLYTKEWHDRNLQDAKNGLCKIIPRYDNSKTTFEKIVGGVDDIIEGETKTVIIVEGLFDKINTDRVLDLDKDREVKCVFTFGCHLSLVQLYKIYEKGVENIILMFDRETIKQTKSVSLILSNYFNIFISELEQSKDPGEMNISDFEKVLSNLKNPINYFVDKIEKIHLR